MLIPAGNSTTSTLHEEPPLMRGTSTCHEGSSLVAGGGAVYLNFDTDDGEISPNPSMSTNALVSPHLTNFVKAPPPITITVRL